MTRRTLRLVALANLAAPAAAQEPSFTTSSTVVMPMRWVEVGGNSNGILEPGESAEVFVNFSFTNQFGQATFAPPIGTFTSGTILGLGSGFVDINGTGGTQGSFLYQPPPKGPGYGVRTGWRLFPNGDGMLTGTGIAQIQFGQALGAPEVINTNNPVARVYRFLWTPSTYAARTVTFSLAGASPAASLVLALDQATTGRAFVGPGNLVLGNVNIPIAPAPAAPPLLALAAAAPRRKRRPHV
jgi:hypothetical protein